MLALMTRSQTEPSDRMFGKMFKVPVYTRTYFLMSKEAVLLVKFTFRDYMWAWSAARQRLCEYIANDDNNRTRSQAASP